jgi:hypothetical protein
MLSVGDRITDDLKVEVIRLIQTTAPRKRATMTHVLQENLQNTTSLLIDKARDTLDTTTASKTTDSL